MNWCYALPICLVALTACGADDGASWGGTISDNGGVALVSNPAEGNWSLQPAPQLTQDLEIGTVAGEAAYQFGPIGGVDVNEAGEILVLDQLAAQVRVFDANGKHLRSLGKPGEGPGELVPGPTLSGLAAGRADTVYVFDNRRYRFVGLAGDGTEIGSYVVTPEEGIPMVIRPAGGGRLAIQLRRLPAAPATGVDVGLHELLIIRDLTAGQTDTVASLETSESVKIEGDRLDTYVFAGQPMWAVLADGRIVLGRSDRYRLGVFTPDGKLERVIERPAERVRVTGADQEAYRGMIIRQTERQLAAAGGPPSSAATGKVDQLLGSMRFADFYPIYAGLMGGPNNTIWVQRFPALSAILDADAADLQNLAAPDWDVFDGQGRLLGKVTLPGPLNSLRVVGNAIYGVQRDEQGVEHVVRLKVQ